MNQLKTNNWEKNLCSIVNDNKEAIDRKFIFELLHNYFLKTGKLYVSVYRPNYVIKDIGRRLEELTPNLNPLIIEKDLWSIFFYFEGSVNQKVIIDLCVDLWFGFEETFFYFLFDVIENLDLLNSDKTSWKDKLSFYSGYIIFHYGMKDDVIFIGKSNDLEFLH